MVSQIRDYVVFQVVCPEASALFLAGDFNDWSVVANPMQQVEPGIWQTQLRLPPGRHHFRYYAVIHSRYTPSEPWGMHRWLDDCDILQVETYGVEDRSTDSSQRMSGKTR